MLLFNEKKRFSLKNLFNFNTSNVTIQLNGINCRIGYSRNFNTSNVTIQLAGIFNWFAKAIEFQYI